MLRKRLLFFLVLIAVLVLPVLAPAAVLWDQPITSTNTTVWPSFFNPNTTWTIYDRYIADDFTNGETWQISKIFIPGSFRSDGQYPFNAASLTYSMLSGAYGAQSFKWEIYNNNGGVPAGTPQGAGNNPAWELSLSSGDPQISISNGVDNYPSDVTLTLSTPFTLNAGTYWLVFYPVIDGTIDGTNGGRYGRNVSLTTNGSNAQFISTDVVSQTQPIVWTSVRDINWWNLSTQDFAFKLEGTAGTPAPNISVAPTSKDFGSVPVNTASANQAFVISNTGDATLNITGINITGGQADQFTKGSTTCGATLGAGLNCTQNVTFTPTSGGSKSTTMAISSNDPDQATYNVALSGLGTVPNISVAPTSKDFGSVPVNTASANQAFVISNTGDATLNITGINITGANADQFTKGIDHLRSYPWRRIELYAERDLYTDVRGKQVAQPWPSASNDPDTGHYNVALSGLGTIPNISVSPTSKDFGSVPVNTHQPTRRSPSATQGTQSQHNVQSTSPEPMPTSSPRERQPAELPLAQD